MSKEIRAMWKYIYTDTHKYLTIIGGLMSALILASPIERIKLLRAGFTGKQIENLYVELNNYRLINTPVLYDAPAN